jgi:hypothetical protein
MQGQRALPRCRPDQSPVVDEGLQPHGRKTSDGASVERGKAFTPNDMALPVRRQQVGALGEQDLREQSRRQGYS